MNHFRRFIWFGDEAYSLRFLLSVIGWLIIGLLVPMVLFLASRVRLDTPPRPGPILFHFVAALILPIIHLAIFAYIAPARILAGEAFYPHFIRSLSTYWPVEFVFYWGSVAVLYMMEYRQESRWQTTKAAQLEAGLAQARLQALRAQLNPHFMFNTLNNISSLALLGQQNAVVDMLSRLSALLRGALDDRVPHEITLEKELEFTEAYLGIQKVRFADKMTVRHDVASDVRDCLVPTMILQPIVENAVVHGIASQEGAGTITIRASRDDRHLRLTVSDTGPGFGGDRSADSKGIGLRNTEERLHHLYGQNQQFECFDGTEGPTVSIRLPFHTAAARVEATVGNQHAVR
jgi:signal transduction histidine kinase